MNGSYFSHRPSRDTPVNLMSSTGAFLNSSVVEHFDNYASIVFQRYGKKVKTWFTFNEPHVSIAPNIRVQTSLITYIGIL